jgi:acid phosphatase
VANDRTDVHAFDRSATSMLFAPSVRCCRSRPTLTVQLGARMLFAEFRNVALAFATALVIACAHQVQNHQEDRAAIDRQLQRIDHIIVIYAENRSFDNLYGLFPKANGIANASVESMTQVDHVGTVLPHLPPVWKDKTSIPDPTFPTQPNRPFRIDGAPVGLPLSKPTRDLVHLFYQNQEQIAGGSMNHFAEVSNAGGLVMGYYDGSTLPMWKLAHEFTLADNFFMGAFGGSFLNHFWLVCACAPVFPNAPPSLVAKLDSSGHLERTPDSPPSALQGPAQYVASAVTPDGYAVNTTQPPYQPSGTKPAADGDPRFADPSENPLPSQTERTIGDALSDKGVSWAWYSGAWNIAVADGTRPPKDARNVIYNDHEGSPNFQAHHQPFNYFARYAPGTAERAEHLKDERDFLEAIDRGSLPQVAFYKPMGRLNSHPGYADVLEGDEHIAAIVERIRKSSLWSSSFIIVTYDENGGFWDHVSPPKGDRWGPGVRIPAILISPIAQRDNVDHTQYDTTSILKFLTRRFKLDPLPGIRPSAGDLTNAIDTSR